MSELKKQELEIHPTQLISSAIEKGLDVSQLEKLMDLQERYEKNLSMKAFNQALNEWQAEKPDISKTKIVSFNGKEKYRYAELAKIQKIVDPILSKCGLSYFFKQEKKDGSIKITCVVRHISGHQEETSLDSDKDASGGKNSIQSIGSTVSYLKRYTLKNALGLSEGDDDGAAISLTPEEVDALALDKIILLKEEKADILEKKENESTLKRLIQIIENKETNSYKKVINILTKL